MEDRVDGGEADALERLGEQVHDAVEGDRGHDVDEERGDFVQGVEDEAVAPHGDRDGVVAVREAVGADEQPLALGKHPDREHAERVDKVAQIGEEVVVAPFLVRVHSDRHEV